MTYSLIHSDFSNGLVRKGKIGLSLSPIVSFKATDPSSKVTTVLSCAIISAYDFGLGESSLRLAGLLSQQETCADWGH